MREDRNGEDRSGEDRIREQLEAMAGEMPAPTAPPPGTLRRARRRAVLTGGVSALAVVVLLLGAFAGVRTILGPDAAPAVSPDPSPSPSGTHAVSPDPSATGTPAPSPSGEPTTPATDEPTPTEETPTGPPPKALLDLGALYEFHDDGSIWYVGTLYGQKRLAPPVQTPYGVLTLGTETNPNWGDLHIVDTTDDGAELIAEDVSGFDVSADGELLAYSVVEQLRSRQPPYYRTTLTLMRLSDHEVVASAGPVVNPESTDGPTPDSAGVGGFVGDRILLTGGDGGAVFSALWDPGSGAIEYLPYSYSGAYATAPASRRAVIAYGDGGCWVLATFPAEGAEPSTREGDCDLLEASFSPDERLFAGGTHDGRVVVIDASSGHRRDEFEVRGVLQTVWEDEDTVLAVARRQRDVSVWRCSVGGACELAFAAPPGYRWTESAYLVPKRPA